MKKKVVALLIMSIFTASMICGCGSKEAEVTPSAESSVASAPVEATVKEEVEVFEKAEIESIVTGTDGLVTVTVKEVKDAVGYRVMFSQEPEFKENVVTIDETANSFTTDKIEKDTTYYVKAQAVKKVDKASIPVNTEATVTDKENTENWSETKAVITTEGEDILVEPDTVVQTVDEAQDQGTDPAQVQNNDADKNKATQDQNVEAGAAVNANNASSSKSSGTSTSTKNNNSGSASTSGSSSSKSTSGSTSSGSSKSSGASTSSGSSKSSTSGSSSSKSSGSSSSSSGSSKSSSSSSSSSSGSGNSSSSSGSGSSSTPSKPAHEHSWQPVYSEKQVYVVDKAAWDEQIAKSKLVCLVCGEEFSDSEEAVEHSVDYAHRYGSKTTYETIHHDEQGHYETQSYVSGYTCSCGATK